MAHVRGFAQSMNHVNTDSIKTDDPKLIAQFAIDINEIYGAESMCVDEIVIKDFIAYISDKNELDKAPGFVRVEMTCNHFMRAFLCQFNEIRENVRFDWRAHKIQVGPKHKPAHFVFKIFNATSTDCSIDEGTNIEVAFSWEFNEFIQQ